jgi:hypothetical protein
MYGSEEGEGVTYLIWKLCTTREEKEKGISAHQLQSS